MPNPNHDPSNGQFTSGPGGLAAGLAAEHAKRKSPIDYAQMSRPTGEAAAFRDKQLAGTLKDHKYPDEVDFPLFHGSRHEFQPGDIVEPGHPGNFVRRMKHVYAADAVEKATQYGSGDVYEVRPLGPIGHRSDARKEQGYWASEWPFEVIRKVKAS